MQAQVRVQVRKGMGARDHVKKEPLDLEEPLGLFFDLT